MDPQLDKSPGLALPQPSHEQSPAGFGPPQAGEVSSEMPPGRPEFAVAAPAAPVPLAVPSVPPSQAGVQTPAVAAPLQPAAALPLSDDDSDALDQEWINKAKAIVERTKTDPYVESSELGKAKADYLRIRFNKQIKIAEDQQR